MANDEVERSTLTTGSEELVLRFQAGDERALERLWSRYLPRLKRWAHGRLPSPSRDDLDTDDLVQDAFVRSLAQLRTITPRGPRSVFAYFRTVVLNQVRDHARRSIRQPEREPLDSSPRADPEPSPLERLVGTDAVRRYETALAQLTEDEQEIITAFVELGCNDRELAELFEKPSKDAARMARNRALARLAKIMTRASRRSGQNAGR